MHPTDSRYPQQQRVYLSQRLGDVIKVTACPGSGRGIGGIGGRDIWRSFLELYVWRITRLLKWKAPSRGRRVYIDQQGSIRRDRQVMCDVDEHPL